MKHRVLLSEQLQHAEYLECACLKVTVLSTLSINMGFSCACYDCCHQSTPEAYFFSCTVVSIILPTEVIITRYALLYFTCGNSLSLGGCCIFFIRLLLQVNQKLEYRDHPHVVNNGDKIGIDGMGHDGYMIQ